MNKLKAYCARFVRCDDGTSDPEVVIVVAVIAVLAVLIICAVAKLQK